MATARFHHHILVFLKHHIVTFIKIQHGYRLQLRGRAAGFGYRAGVHEIHERLYYSVVRGVHRLFKRKGTVAVAEEGRVTLWRDHPVRPTEVLETDVQRTPLTLPVCNRAAERNARGRKVPLIVECAPFTRAPCAAETPAKRWLW